MLQGLVTRDGGTVIRSAILADDANLILRHLRENTDLVLLSGGSSAGDEDHAPRLLRQFGDLSIHGVALRPGGPAGLGTLEGHLVALLPGNPVACLCAYDLFAGRALRRATGMPNWPYRRVQIPLANDIVSSIGRVDYARVIIEGGGVQWIGKSGASRLSSTTRSTGFVIVPADRPVLEKGEKVDVFFYD
jgi:molybdopterin molybdotransferase